MASLILRAFGGMAPSANAKAIDPATATYAQNLNQRFSDFRPLPGALVVGAAAAGATLYRFETSGGFITRAGQVNFVRGPIPTDATERTYYTGDGAPKVTDTSGNVRLLGVPAPLAAPGVTVNKNDEYSEDDEAAAQAAALATITQTIWNNCARPYVGLSDADLAAKFEPGPPGAPWTYSFVVAGTMANGAFSPTNPAHRNLIDDRLGFHIGTVGGVTKGWADVHVRGAEVKLNAGLSAALQAIADPSDVTGVKKLMTSAQAATVITNLENDLKPLQAGRDAAIARLRALQAEFVTVADTATAVGPAGVGAVREFYQRPEIMARINAYIETSANAILGAVRTYDYPIDDPYTQVLM